LRLFAGAVLMAAVYCAHAQVITTLAGTDFAFPPTPLAAINAPAGLITGVAADAAGNVYFASPNDGNNVVFKVDRQGVLTVVAGNGTEGFSGDGGQATSAALDSPGGLAVDAAGNLFIADGFNNRIRKVTPGGIISTVAGNGMQGYSGDGGQAMSAALNLNGSGSVAVDAAGNLFISDEGNNRIRKVTPGGIINTVAGNGTAGYSGDNGLATSAALNLSAPFVVGVVVDASGNLFIADALNNRIRKVTTSGIISTVAGNGTAGFSGDDGPATYAELNLPAWAAVDASGNLFVADQGNGRIRKVTPGGIISTVAGNGTEGYSGDGGAALNAAFDLPTGVAIGATGDLFIADSLNGRIREVTSDGVINTLAGNGRFQFAGDGGPAISAALNFPTGVAVDTFGNLFIADYLNNRIRKVTSAGIISTAAGDGIFGYSGDGVPAANTSLSYPASVTVDPASDMFIADTFNNRIRMVTPGGIISTVAGNGAYAYSGDGGPALSAALNSPTGVAVDAAGSLFIADQVNNRIRMVTSGGIISTVAGNGTQGYSGDGGSAISAALNLPSGVAVDAAGNFFIADEGNNRIRMVTPGGVISTVAGNGTQGYSGDRGQATTAALSLNVGSAGAAFGGIAVDAAGNLFIADTGNNVIRKVTPSGIINTVAGNGMFEYYGDGGPATSAGLAYPAAVTVDAAGNLYIADTFNNRIRVVLATAPGVSVAPLQLQFTASSNGAPTAPQTFSVTSPVDGLAFSASVPANASWLQLNPSSGTSPRLIQVIADPTGLAPTTYQTTITINTPNANPTSIAVAVTFTVTAAMPPVLSIDKASLSFPFPQHDSSRSQNVTVSNLGGGSLQFTATPTTSTGGNWLSVSPASAQALPGTPVPVTVTANPAGLSPGTYSGQVSVVAGAQKQTVAITMTISKLNQAIWLSQTGLSFLAVQGGGVVPPQSLGVTNIGTGVVNWTASTSTLSGGPDWLQVTPTSGSSDVTASAVPRVTVSVNASALPAGAYYGLVRVDAPGAANTPQVMTVSLQVLPANANVAGVVQPGQLLFSATAGAESPGSQVVQVYNIVAGARSFQSQVSATNGLPLAVLPQDATLDPQQPTSIVVQPFTTGLSAGVYNAVLTLQFSDGSVSPVAVTVVVSNPAATSPYAARSEARSGPSADAGTSCTPTKLIPVLTTLGQTFTVSAGWPTALIVNVIDDCGAPMQATGSVAVNFSNGDPPLSLLSQGGGTWESTWQTGNSSTGVTLNVRAADPQGVTGDEEVTGNLASQQQPPVFSLAGITSAAVAASFTALAPGSVISIYGNRLAESTAQAQTLPLPPKLVDTQVFVAGTSPEGVSTGLIDLPLYYVSQTQVNAMVPYEVNVNTSLQLLVQRGTTFSLPVQVNMAQAQPAVFSSGGVPGSAGLIFVFPVGGGPPHLASPSAPAHAGDTIVLYCTGLGAVNPVVTDGAAPGKQLSNTVAAAQLTVGGQSAHVSFAGLTPGFAGLYQVNAVVPSGTGTGAKVSVTLAIDGQTSPPITLAIE
jgi:trimeric autotransporter adhesin